MPSANPAQNNILVFQGEDYCANWLITHPGESLVYADAKSGDTEIRVEKLHRALVDDDVLIFVQEDGSTYRAYVNAVGGVVAGQAAGAEYQVITVDAIAEKISKGSRMFVARDIRDVTWDYEVRKGFYIDAETNNLISGTTVSPLDTTEGATDDPTKRGFLQITIPRAATSGMDVSLTNLNRQTLDVWARATLPTLSNDDTTHPYRHQLVEVTSDDKRFVQWAGVVVVADSVTTASNDGGG